MISCRVCVDCGKGIPFTVTQQRFFEKKGFDKPKRCQECRKARHKPRQDALNQIRTNYDVNGLIRDVAGYSQARNRVECAHPKPGPQCTFCHNIGHREGECRIKKSATCPITGKVGRAISLGFAQASGRRNVGQPPPSPTTHRVATT
eukprot:GHVR01116291.1.p2 GENE.GHVR01116291.1~~GHVR01116291.1.p2  ORF type:complete len:147 (-),score=3.49 GHVR01116291.1:227-667(-)